MNFIIIQDNAFQKRIIEHLQTKTTSTGKPGGPAPIIFLINSQWFSKEMTNSNPFSKR